jgi:hypothetical protein
MWPPENSLEGTRDRGRNLQVKASQHSRRSDDEAAMVAALSTGLD